MCKTPHLNNKQSKNTNPIISRRAYHLTQPCLSEEKQTNKQKLSTNLTLYEAHTNHWTNLRRAETKRKNSIFFKERFQLSLKPGKRRSQTQQVKKERQINTIQMKEQTRKKEVQT